MRHVLVKSFGEVSWRYLLLAVGPASTTATPLSQWFAQMRIRGSIRGSRRVSDGAVRGTLGSGKVKTGGLHGSIFDVILFL